MKRYIIVGKSRICCSVWLLITLDVYMTGEPAKHHLSLCKLRVRQSLGLILPSHTGRRHGTSNMLLGPIGKRQEKTYISLSHWQKTREIIHHSEPRWQETRDIIHLSKPYLHEEILFSDLYWQKTREIIGSKPF